MRGALISKLGTVLRLAGTNLLVLTSDDGLAPEADRLAAAVKAAGGRS